MLDDLIKERQKKRDALKAAGIDPYPARVLRTVSIGEALADFSALAKARKKLSLVGRVMGKRGHGGVFFLDLRDESGSIQIVSKKDELKNFSLLQENIDIGDFVSVAGIFFVTQKGEKSIAAKVLSVVAKSLRPLPSEWYGLSDVETRLRKRYLDLIFHPELKDLFIKKSRFWNAFRAELLTAGFLEVETPVLESVPGGADAEPFVTHHNALDLDLYLRIAEELPQKKLLVGGYEKTFEIGRVFRNEGIDHEHLQDYTQLEFYWAYADYKELMKFVEKLYKSAIKNVFGSLVIQWQGQKINWGKKWQIVDYSAAFKKYVGLDLASSSREKLLDEAQKRGLKPEPALGRGRLIDLLYKKLVRPTLIEPAFLINPPADVEPLAKRLSENPAQVERFQVVACGTELGKGFSENNDPEDQRARFEEQMRLRAAGDKEAQRIDEDFLEALEYGMPPAAGFGVSYISIALVTLAALKGKTPSPAPAYQPV